ncbi:MAG: HlyD family efflux transporter periplasmic adaptor subunit [Candidatus Ventricola sp.]|nr:HlyD family efflux transporter periplasmic adaptor subunit [Candidatus Ventricola sp.]
MSETKQKKRRGRAGRSIKKWIKRLILLAVVLAAILFGLKAYIKNQAANSDTESSYSQTQVMRGAMSETVYGTGTTSARNQPNVLAEADGTLTDLRVSVGDEVKAGDILAVLTNDEIDDTITDLEFALWDLDAQITETRAGSKVSSIEAPVAGRVVAIYAKAGDDALAVFRREGTLAVISTDERMKVELTSAEGALGLALDEKVTVIGEHIYAEGTVVELTRQGTQATITVMEDDLPMNKDYDGDGKADMIMGRTVEVRNADNQIIGEGTLEPNKPMAVSAFGGTITYVDAILGSKVGRTERMFRLTDSPLTLTIEELRLQREASAKELEEAKEQRENLIIVAPCDGTVATLDVEEGDEITSGTLIGSILQGEDMNLTIAVDELDVVQVEIGQPVSITIDALSSLELTGEVYKIAPVGNNSGGVTTYDVELTFDAAGTGVRSGMNATGEIEVASADDVLYVPVEALMTIKNQTYVMVADGGTTVLADAAQSAASGSQRGSRGQGMQGGMPSGGQMPDMGDMPQMGEMPEGMPQGGAPAQTEEETGLAARAKSLVSGVVGKVRAWLYEGVETTSAAQVTGSLVKVEVGMQNDDYAQITSGLSEGDVVLYTASDDDNSSSMFGGMMMGGMGGGSMGGGAPGGGMGGMR